MGGGVLFGLCGGVGCCGFCVSVGFRLMVCGHVFWCVFSGWLGGSCLFLVGGCVCMCFRLCCVVVLRCCLLLMSLICVGWELVAFGGWLM